MTKSNQRAQSRYTKSQDNANRKAISEKVIARKFENECKKKLESKSKEN